MKNWVICSLAVSLVVGVLGLASLAEESRQVTSPAAAIQEGRSQEFTLEPQPPADATAKAAQRRDTAHRALAWLVQVIESKDWDKFQDSKGEGTNHEAQRYIATLMTAWLLEAHADAPEFAKARRSFRERADRLLADKVPFEFFATWCDGFAGLYAYERTLKDGKVHPALDRIARNLVAEQNDEGGWNNIKNFTKLIPIYSRSINAISSLALVALGAAERAQTPFAADEKFKKAVKDGVGLLRQSQGANGGFMYGKLKKHGGPEVGRTAGLLTALVAVRQTDTDLFRAAATYVARNVESIPKGHGCTSFHLALGSLACYILSEDIFRHYEAKVLEQVPKLQLADGSFKKGLGKDFPNSGKGNDLFDKAYPTALFAVALSADRFEVARQLRLNPPFKLSDEKKKL